MKALSVKQPWAHLIANGIKQIENRTWATHYRGPLAIHASKTPPPLSPDNVAAMRYVGVKNPYAMDYGSIIAIADMIDCVRLADLPPSLTENPFAEGPYCWILMNVRKIEPIKCQGKLGLWEYT